jgi:hypothetical protein
MPVVTVKYLAVFSNLTGLSCLRGLSSKCMELRLRLGGSKEVWLLSGA